jgi:hypothetical protein
VVRADVAAVAQVQVTGEAHVDVAVLHLVERAARAVHDAVHALAGRRDERVVRYHDLEHARRQLARAQLDVEQLLLADAAVLPEPVERPRPRPCGVDADDEQLLVLVDRADVFRDVLVVVAQRPAEALDEVEQRDVVVAGDDELRLRQSAHERHRVLVLPRAGALREVAAHDDERRLLRVHVGDAPLDDGGVDVIEVDVGDVGDRAHAAAQRGGTLKKKTFSPAVNDPMISPAPAVTPRQPPTA